MFYALLIEGKYFDSSFYICLHFTLVGKYPTEKHKSTRKHDKMRQSLWETFRDRVDLMYVFKIKSLVALFCNKCGILLFALLIKGRYFESSCDICVHFTLVS